MQELPRFPQVVVLGFMQVPPWQQPVKQLSALQLPPPEPPLDDPDELPLEDPDELPLEDPDSAAHAPLWHVWLVAVQSTHDDPCSPHAESSVPMPQLPFASQQPPQFAAQPLPLASSPVAPSSPALAPSSPDEPPLTSPLLLPLLPLLPLLFKPGPSSVAGADDAASTTPAS